MRNAGRKLPASYRHFVLVSGNAGWFIGAFGTLDGDGKLSNVSAIDVYPFAAPKNFGYWAGAGPVNP